MMKLIVSVLAFFSFLVPVAVFDAAPVADAYLYNCSVWYEYRSAKGRCGSFNSSAPIQTRYYVYTKCHSPIHPDYWIAGNYVSFPYVSTATCAAYFQPQSAYLVKTA